MNLGSDGEVGHSGGEEGGVGVGSTALSLAESELNLVDSGSEGLRLRSLSLEVELDSVLSSLHAGVELASAEGHVFRGDDVEDDLSSAGSVNDGESSGDLEGGSLRAGGGVDDEGIELGNTAVLDGAGVEQLAEVDGVDVLAELVEELDEGVDANSVAEKSADLLLGVLVGESNSAELTATSDDSNVKNGVQELVDTLAHELGADVAERELESVGGLHTLETRRGDTGRGSGQKGEKRKSDKTTLHFSVGKGRGERRCSFGEKRCSG